MKFQVIISFLYFSVNYADDVILETCEKDNCPEKCRDFTVPSDKDNPTIVYKKIRGRLGQWFSNCGHFIHFG